MIFAPYGSCEAVDSLKMSSSDAGTISTIENAIQRFLLFFVTVFHLSQHDTHFPNSGATNTHAMALSLSLTHEERCATKLCARKCQKYLEIFHLRPKRDQHIVSKWSPNWLMFLKIGFWSCALKLDSWSSVIEAGFFKLHCLTWVFEAVLWSWIIEAGLLKLSYWSWASDTRHTIFRTPLT